MRLCSTDDGLVVELTIVAVGATDAAIVPLFGNSISFRSVVVDTCRCDDFNAKIEQFTKKFKKLFGKLRKVNKEQVQRTSTCNGVSSFCNLIFIEVVVVSH